MIININIMNMMKICKRCDYEWDSKTEYPKSCPACKSYRWAVPKDYVAPGEVKPIASKTVLGRAEKLENLRNLISQPAALEAGEVWVFGKGSTQYADDGCAYRDQWLSPEMKKKRVVEVDIEDHDRILRVL